MLVAPGTFVALGTRVWCLGTFVDLVSYRASHDSPRNPKGVQPQSPGLRRRGATPGPCPTYKQPQRGCAEATSGEAPAVWLDPAEWATPLLVFNISTHTVGGHRRVRCFGTTALRLLRFSDTHPGQRGEPRNPGLWGRTPLVFREGTVAWEGSGETWRDISSCDIPDGATPGLGCETGMSGRGNGERPGVARRTAQPGLGAQRPWALGRGKGRAANGR